MSKQNYQNSPKAFVLMPFEPEFNQIFDDLIEPALSEAGYKVERADTRDNQQNVLKDIVRGIEDADLVVADLSTSNPNVFYELGISHGFEKHTILLTQSINDVPFDLRSYRLIKYSANYREAQELFNKLKDTGIKAMEGSIEFGNPVTDFKRLTKEKVTGPRQAIIEVSDEGKPETVIEGKDVDGEEKGIWDFVSEAEESVNEINLCTDSFSAATQELTSKLEERTAAIQKLQHNNLPGQASKIRQVASSTAADLNQYATKIKENLPKFHAAWVSFDENTTGLLTHRRVIEEKDLEAIRTFHGNVAELKSAVSAGLEPIKGFRDNIKDLIGLSRDMNIAQKRTNRILDSLIAEMEIADSFCAKILTLLDEMLNHDE